MTKCTAISTYCCAHYVIHNVVFHWKLLISNMTSVFQSGNSRKYTPFNQDFTLPHRSVFSSPAPLSTANKVSFSYLCPKWSIRFLKALPDLGLISRPPRVHIIHILKKTRIFGQKFVFLALFKSWKLEIFELLLFFFVLFVIFPAARFNLFAGKK